MSHIPDLTKWTEQQLQKPEVLQNMLLAEQDKTELSAKMLASALVEQEAIKERCQKLLNMFDGVALSNRIAAPLNPFIASAKQEYVLLEHYEKGWFSERETKLTVQYKTGKRIYAVYQERKGLFAKTASKTFDTFEVAIRFFNKVTL